MGQSRRVLVSFNSDGDDCMGYLYLPAVTRPGERLAGIVLCPGFGSTMDRLEPQATAFAEAGLAALVFDYRSFGASAGHPRQVVDIAGQLADVRAAVAYLRGRDEMDRGLVVLWGNSLGGAHAITVAADDPDIAAVLAQIPFNGFPRRVAGRSTRNLLRLLAAILLDRLRGKLRLSPHYIPLVGEPGQVAVTTAAAAKEHIATLTEGQTLWQNRTAPRSLLRMMRYHPSQDAARLRMPLLVCVATDDEETPEELTRELAEAAPEGRLKRYPGTHFTFYHDEHIRRTALSDQIAFCRAVLDRRVGSGLERTG